MNYFMIGGDKREYGPVDREEVRAWIADGRANAATSARLDEGPWKPLRDFDEFKDALAAALPANRVVVIGLICSVMGLLFCCPVIGSVLGIVLSVIGLKQIQAQPGIYFTDPFVAKIGIGLGIAGLIVSLLAWPAMAKKLIGGFQDSLKAIG